MPYLLFVAAVVSVLSELSFAYDSAGLLAAAPVAALPQRRRGRPRKFDAPSRAVTLTLPEDVIARLSTIHRDLSRAVAAVVRKSKRASLRAADLLVFGQQAVITIRPTPSLERDGVQLVPLPDGRALISFKAPMSLAALQLTLSDALADGTLPSTDRVVYEKLYELLRRARQSPQVTVQERHIIVLETAGATRGNSRALHRKAKHSIE